MKKTAYLVIAIASFLASLKGISAVAYGVLERGLEGVNYGALIPVLIGIWSFVQWRNIK